MRLLRHQWPQHRDQLGSGNILQPQHLGNIRFRGNAGGSITDTDRRRAGVLVLYHPHHATGSHRGVTVDIQDRKKQLVELTSGDRLGGNDLHFALDGGVDHNGLAGGLGDKFDQFLDIGVVQVDGVILRRERGTAEQQRQQQCQCTQGVKPVCRIH